MKIDGEVTTGLGKAAHFLSQDFYTREFKKNLGFIPFPGTLNVIVGQENIDEINDIKDSCENLIKPDEGFGAVKYIEAVLNDEINGAIVFPAKTTHEENYLEFIAEEKLREKLDLRDGDLVSLEF
jgi:riboflavin kinase